MTPSPPGGLKRIPVRFSATLGEELEVEVALCQRLSARACSQNCVQGGSANFACTAIEEVRREKRSLRAVPLALGAHSGTFLRLVLLRGALGNPHERHPQRRPQRREHEREGPDR